MVRNKRTGIHTDISILYIISRYHELFFMIDTCQAQSMFQKFYSPNLLGVASSHVGEDSLSVSQYVLDLLEINMSYFDWIKTFCIYHSLLFFKSNVVV